MDKAKTALAKIQAELPETRAEIMQPDGTQPVVNDLGPTDFFGELALLTEGPRTASVVATAPTQCLVLTHWNFSAVVSQASELYKQELGGLAALWHLPRHQVAVRRRGPKEDHAEMPARIRRIVDGQ